MTDLDVTIRPATAADQPTIRAMVRQEMLDPTGLHWSHFWVAEARGQIVGIGQIRPKGVELGSLIVKKEMRGRGIAGRLIRALLATREGPVYLECQGHMASYYAQFGFEEIRPKDAPFPLNLKSGIGKTLARLFGMTMAVMRHPNEQKGESGKG